MSNLLHLWKIDKKTNAMQTLLVEFDMICKQKITRALRLNGYNTEDDNNNNKNWLIDID